VELEYEAPVLTQLPVEGHEVSDDGTLRLLLGLKHADCLAKDVCLPDLKLPTISGTCSPSSGCC
jgi:hypothetical protein